MLSMVNCSLRCCLFLSWFQNIAYDKTRPLPATSVDFCCCNVSRDCQSFFDAPLFLYTLVFANMSLVTKSRRSQVPRHVHMLCAVFGSKRSSWQTTLIEQALCDKSLRFPTTKSKNKTKTCPPGMWWKPMSPDSWEALC